MDIYQYRRSRLTDYIAAYCNGDKHLFAEKSGLGKVRVGQLLSETFRNGRNFGAGVARKLETRLNLPAFYFDRGAFEGSGEPIALPPAMPPLPSSGDADIDPGEQMLMRVYRDAGEAVQTAMQKIARVMSLADDKTIGELTYQFSRAVAERTGLQVVPASVMVPTQFDENERYLLNGFRRLKPYVQRLIMHAAACSTISEDDDDIDPETNCTRREMRLIAAYRGGSAVLRRALLDGVSTEEIFSEEIKS